MVFTDGYQAQCEHGRIYQYSVKKNNWEAENPEPNTGEIGCSRCLYIMISEKRSPKLLPLTR